jgi:hypothetical protein
MVDKKTCPEPLATDTVKIEYTPLNPLSLSVTAKIYSCLLLKVQIRVSAINTGAIDVIAINNKMIAIENLDPIICPLNPSPRVEGTI